MSMLGDVRRYVVAGQSIFLAPDGNVAIAMWDFDMNYVLWAQAAEAVDPEYVNPPVLLSRHWTGCAQFEAGLKRADFRNVHGGDGQKTSEI